MSSPWLLSPEENKGERVGTRKEKKRRVKRGGSRERVMELGKKFEAMLVKKKSRSGEAKRSEGNREETGDFRHGF